MAIFGIPATFDASNRFSTSWLLSPAALFFQRLLFALYAFVTLFVSLGLDGRNAGSSFSYFTHLTYWGLAFYNAFAALHTFSYWRSSTPLLARWPRVLQELHSIFYSSIVVFPFIVTIVFWTLLSASPFKTQAIAWSNISQHALNSFYALTEIILPRTEPLPWYHILPIIIILALYLGLAYLTYATQGFYVYNFLDPKNGRGHVAAYVVGILVASVIVFIIVKYLIWLRVWVTEKKLGKTGKFSARDKAREVRKHDAHEMQNFADEDGHVV